MSPASATAWIGRAVLHRLIACAGAAALLVAAPTRADELLIFAAASLKPALDTLIATPQARAIADIKVSYAASSQLARQIEHDAPANLFISADPDWMDHVGTHGRIVAGTRSDLLGNALVLIAPRGSAVQLKIAPGFDLLGALGGDGRLAMAEPNSVPAGKYARNALIALGVWTQIESRIVPATHVRAALSFVVREETPLGIVYRSDAESEPKVRVVDTFPASSHAPIVYPAALLKDGDTEAARQLLALLHSTPAAEIFRRYGFDRLTP